MVVGMFALKSTVERWRDRAALLEVMLSLEKENGKVLTKVLERERKRNRISTDDIRKLIQLCHPDRHDGSPLAVEMTQKLLKMKDG